MPVPKKRHSNIRQGKRRASNYRLSAVNLSRCATCGAPTLSHQLCQACGSYRGRSVIKIEEKGKKKTKGGEKK
jgi:large subunit ribosomal protein L32